MKMDQLYRRFRGTVRFTAEGGHALRMPGLLAADGIPLYGVTPTDLGFEAEIAAEHYRKAAKAARRTGTRIRLREKHGISFWLFQNRKRRGLFAGILAAVLVMAFLSRFVGGAHRRHAGALHRGPAPGTAPGIRPPGGDAGLRAGRRFH